MKSLSTKYIQEAFKNKHRNRFDMLYMRYAELIFSMPIQTFISLVKDELGIKIEEQQLYNYRKRLKRRASIQNQPSFSSNPKYNINQTSKAITRIESNSLKNMFDSESLLEVRKDSKFTLQGR